MKLNTFEKRLFIFCCLIIVVFSYLLFDDSMFFSERTNQSDPVAELVGKKQDVRLKFSENFSWTPAREQEKLYPFDSIFTGDNSTAILKLNDDTVLRIDGQSLIVLSVFEGQLVLDLKSGSLSGDLSQKSNLLLKTKDGFQKLSGKEGRQIRLEKDFAGQSLQRVDRLPAAINDQLIWKSPKFFKVNKQDPKTYQNLSWLKTGTIKETVIEISSTEDFSLTDKLMKTSKLESGLPMELPQGQYFVRLKGYNAARKQTATSTVQSFEMIDQKKASLPPPVLLTQNINHSDTFNFPPLVKWENVDLAQKYRVEMSMTPRFESVVRYETGQTDFAWEQFRPGTYFFRLYSMNEEEISLPSDIGTIEVASEAPQLAPIPRILVRSKDKNVGPQKVQLNWQHRGRSAAQYRVEISKDGTFRDARVIETERGPASVQIKSPGEYSVRVFATNNDGVPTSPSSNVEKINYDLKNLLPPPELVKPFSETTVFLQSDDNPYLWLDWKPVQEAEFFNVEVATDPEFTRIIASEKTNANRYLIVKRIPYGRYFWRVKSISESEKTDSDWSQTNRFYLIHKKKDIFFE